MIFTDKSKLCHSIQYVSTYNEANERYFIFCIKRLLLYNSKLWLVELMFLDLKPFANYNLNPVWNLELCYLHVILYIKYFVKELLYSPILLRVHVLDLLTTMKFYIINKIGFTNAFDKKQILIIICVLFFIIMSLQPRIMVISCKED